MRGPRGFASTCSPRQACCRCPTKTPLNPVVFDELKHADYTVSKVYFESLPGFFVTGNLYRPVGEGPFPAVLSAHGHWAYRAPRELAAGSGPGRAINLARQGFVVFTPDMVGYNDSRQLTHTFGGPREHLWGLSLAGLQLWNSIRSLDFLESLPYVKRTPSAATGASGGGTQTFLLAAVDERVTVAAPVNMISLHMQGGCLCENLPGLRLDTTNVEIAATIAPRPLLMVSATGDWTDDTLEKEYPAVRAIYALMGAQDRVHAVRFDRRAQLQQGQPRGDVRVDGALAERRALSRAWRSGPYSVDTLPALLVFHGRALPEGAITAGELTASWIDDATQQLARRRSRCVPPRSGTRSRSPRASPPSQSSSRAGGARVLRCWLRGRCPRSMPRCGRLATPFAPSRSRRSMRRPPTRCATSTHTTGPPASHRVADIVAALRTSPDAILVAAGDAALAGALASAIAAPRLAILDVKGFDTGRDEDFLAHVYMPGLRRAGDVQTASEMAPGRLVVHNAGPRFAAPGARVQQVRLAPAEIVKLVKEAAAARRR